MRPSTRPTTPARDLTWALALVASVTLVVAVGAAAARGVVTGREASGSLVVAATTPPANGTPGPVLSPVATVGSRAGPESSAPRPGVRWRWPLAPRPPVARPFRAPVSAWGAGHRGLDLVARRGAAVLAVEGGRVTHAGVVAGRGTVSVEHVDGLVSTYEPVQPGVVAGDVVAVGDALGLLGPGGGSHCGAATCLHLGARRAGAYLDPWPLLAGGELALLPLG